MKPLGIVRRIDDIGRVVIPKDIRRQYNLEEGDPLEFFTTEEGILLKKFNQAENFNWEGLNDYLNNNYQCFTTAEYEEWKGSIRNLRRIIRRVEGD